MANLTYREWNTLHKLSFSKDSAMKSRLEGVYGNAKNTYIVMAYDTRKETYVGWAFAEPTKEGTANVGVYVKYAYRRKGIGKKLINAVLKYSRVERATCFLVDEVATKFWNSFGAKRYRRATPVYSDEAWFEYDA